MDLSHSASTKTGRVGGGWTRRGVKAASVRRWVVRARRRGLTVGELVAELHVRRGLPLGEVARVLGLEEVGEVWRLRQCREVPRVVLAEGAKAACLAKGPESEGEVKALREQVSLVLWQTVEATFPGGMPEAEGEKGKENGEQGGEGAVYAFASVLPMATPPMLSVRLKALRQIAELHELGRKGGAGAGAVPVQVPYATPEEIGAAVRERLLAMHGGVEGGSRGMMGELQGWPKRDTKIEGKGD